MMKTKDPVTMNMSRSLPELREPCSPSTVTSIEYDDYSTEEAEETVILIAQSIERLHAKASSAKEKEEITSRLLSLAEERRDARLIIGSNAQAMPLFISILRSGPPQAKIHVAAILSAICKDEDLRVKVLLGGCVPPLLTMLKCGSLEARRGAAEAIYEVSVGWLSDDHAGMKIFLTEGVVPTLWEQLNANSNQDKVVQGYVAGALRNLCGDKEGYWRATIEAGGVDRVVVLLSSENSSVQSNSAYLLSQMMLAFNDSVLKVIKSGAIDVLLNMLAHKNDVSVRASAADALEILASRSEVAKKEIVEADGVNVLIEAVVAPAKERVKNVDGQALQRRATRALGSICGGMGALVRYLGKLAVTCPGNLLVADIIGALAYVLMVYEESDDDTCNPSDVERLLIMMLKRPESKLVRERILESMASLYANPSLSRSVPESESKMVLVALTTIASGETRDSLMNSLTRICEGNNNAWKAIGKKDGVQLLVSLFGLASEQQQEYAVRFLSILTDHFDESKWAITAGGGIPPLVHLLDTASDLGKEYATHVLGNLCSHSEDIRACVESAGASTGLLLLVKNGRPSGQISGAKTLSKLFKTYDSATANHLLAMLIGETPRKKGCVIKVLGHLLTLSSYKELVNHGTSANKSLKALVSVLSSSNEETQEAAASVLADIFTIREDICSVLASDEIINPCVKLITESDNETVATQLARALGALTKTKSNKISYITEGDVKPLMKLAKTSSVHAAESAVAALANLLYVPEIALEALEEGVADALLRILNEGTIDGKKNTSRALCHLLKHFSIGDVLRGNSQSRTVVVSALELLKGIEPECAEAGDVLELISLLVRTKQGVNAKQYQPLAFSSESSSSLEGLVSFLVDGTPALQDNAIKILASVCREHSNVVSNLMSMMPASFSSLASRVAISLHLDVKVSATALLVSISKHHKEAVITTLDSSGTLKPLVYSLVEMVKVDCEKKPTFRHEETFDVPDPADGLSATVALWLLSILSSYDSNNRKLVADAGGLEAVYNKIGYHSETKGGFVDAENVWICSLLMAILFKEDAIALAPTTISYIPAISHVLGSEEIHDRYFAAEAMASLASTRDKLLCIVIAESGAASGLISLIGYSSSDTDTVAPLSDEFSLLSNPAVIVLQNIFEFEEVRLGNVARKAIPSLIDLLRPIADRPGAALTAVKLLNDLSVGSDSNKLVMSEAGAVDALTKYLSLSPVDSTEVCIMEVMRSLFENREIVRKDASVSTLNQLTAVLRLGSREARLSVARTLHELFEADHIRNCEAAIHAIQPLLDMLNGNSEIEQEASLVALMKLVSTDVSKAVFFGDAECNPLPSLLRILTSATASDELKRNATELCFTLFGTPKFRVYSLASAFLAPLLNLIRSGNATVTEAGVRALERLLEDEKTVREAVTDARIIQILVGLVSGGNHRLIEASVCTLIKLGTDRVFIKLEMVKSGVIGNCLSILPQANDSLSCSISKLFRILTNTNAIARSSEAAKMVEPLFILLMNANFSLWGQHSALQSLVNILEKPQSLATLKLTPSQVIVPLISFLESPSQAIQHLGTELLSHLLALEHFQQDITTKNAAVPLVKLAGIGILTLQQTAINALEKISSMWPKAVAKAGGIFQLSKVILQDDPEPPNDLWETTGIVLTNVLSYSKYYFMKVSHFALVKMLHSSSEVTVRIALRALIVQEKNNPASAVKMTEAGVVGVLLELLSSHHCEEFAGRLLEALFNNPRVREMKISKYALGPLSEYLLNPQTKSNTCKLLSGLALGNLSQHGGVVKSTDSVSACRALVSLLESQPSEEMTMVAICALQNFVINSNTNRRAVAEAGGILVVQELLLSPSADVAGQAAMLIKYLFSNHALQEYVSNELVRSLTAALERQLWSAATINVQVLRTVDVIFANFPKLHVSEAATLCIPHLVNALKTGSEDTQDSALDTLCRLKQSWTLMPIDVAKSQLITTAEAIPVLQMLMKTCPPSFHDRADLLLHCLPGCLTVTIKRGNNLKQTISSTNAFCRLTLGSGPSVQTKVVSNSTNPEWKERFKWDFDVPPKGQKLQIICKSKNTFGKSTLGRVTIQIDKVVSEGVYSGPFGLNHDSNKSGALRSLDIEIMWTSRAAE